MAASSSAHVDAESKNIVLITGGVEWDQIGGKDVTKGGSLVVPHVFASLADKDVVALSSGCSANHAFFLSRTGEVFALGRNKTGQLGLGDTSVRAVPELVKALKGKGKFVQAACGRHHSLFLAEDGSVYAAGDNKSGQCGQSQLSHVYTTPSQVQLGGNKAVSIAAGVDFSLVLLETGAVVSFGSPQYGQLGHGTDGQVLEKANKIVFTPQSHPKEIAVLAGKKIVEVVCGNNHSVALSDQGAVFCWGFAGNGRLGLTDQKDQFVPKELPIFTSRPHLKATRIAAGAQVSFAVTVSTQTYCWGKYKTMGDANMYPKPVQDLMGWKVRDISCGNISNIVLADSSVIAWGQGAIGELGFGEAQKGSANPKKVDILEGVPGIVKASCSYATTFFLVKDGEAVKRFAQYAPEPTKAATASSTAADGSDAEETETGKKRKTPTATASRKKATK